MDHMIGEMLEAGGLPAFVADMAMLAKYILTMFFLGCGINYFLRK